MADLFFSFASLESAVTLAANAAAGLSQQAAAETAQSALGQAAAQGVQAAGQTETASQVLESAAAVLPDLVKETEPVREQVANDLMKLNPSVVMEWMKSLVPDLAGLAYNLLIAVLILLIGMKLVRMAKKVSLRFFQHLSLDTAVSRFLTSCVGAVLYGILIFVIADRLGISSASIIALLGSAGIAISLALQGSLSNFAGGVLILLTKPFKTGDYIISKDGEGTVKNIGIIYTKLVKLDNQVVILPNGALSNSPLTNMTASDRRRLIIPVNISYEDDLKAAKELLRQLFLKDARILKEDGVEVYVSELGDSAVGLCVRGWTKTEDYWNALWDLTEEIKLAFDAAGICLMGKRIEVSLTGGGKK